MQARFLTPLAYVFFGLLVTASAQDASRKSEQNCVTCSYSVADLVIPWCSETPVVRITDPPRKEALAYAQKCPPSLTSAKCPTPATKNAPAMYCQEGQPAKVPTLEDSLIKIITNTIQPHCWRDHGGSCTIDYHPLGKALVINADPEAHEQIAHLLQSLRKLQDQMVTLDVRVISVADGVFERLGYDVMMDGKERRSGDFRRAEDGRGPAQQGPGNLRNAFLNEAEVERLLMALQGDPRTSACQSLRTTVASGRTAKLMLTEQRTFVTGMEKVQIGGQEAVRPKQEARDVGLIVTARPTVSADGRYVELNLDTECSRLVPPKPALFPVTTFITPVFEGGAPGRPVPFTQFIQQPIFNIQRVVTTLQIPDGRTALIDGLKQTREAEPKYAHPLIARMPGLQQLFKANPPRKEMEAVVVMVTPRIVVCKDEIKALVVSTPRPPATSFPVPVAPQFVAPALPMMDRHFKPAAWNMQQAIPQMKAAPSFRAKQVARLMDMYQEACAGGHHDEARKLAAFALELDPACFTRPK